MAHPSRFFPHYGRWIFFIAVCCISLFSDGQINKTRLPKLSILLQEKMGTIDSVISVYSVVVTDTKSFREYLSTKKDLSIIKEYAPAGVMLVKGTWGQVKKYLLNSNLVTFIDEQRIPKEELHINGFDLTTNKINVVHNSFPQLKGDSLVVSVKENKPDTTDIDFKGRFQATTIQSVFSNSHASVMATMIAGGGNSSREAKGVAWGATITSSDYSVLLPDPDAAYKLYNISVQNHSYGTGIENFYGADAAAYDVSAVNNPILLHVFSAGNSGNLTGTVGPYAGVNNYANITGSFKMAKNIITTGATDSFQSVAAQSSKGPAYDGRVKPELVAFGIDGSSGAAALVSGTALLLQQQYKQANAVMPPNALVKAVLLNSADDVGNKEIDYTSGYGSLNAINAVRTLEKKRVLNGAVANGGTQTFPLVIPPGIKKVKVTLVWNDPPAAANAPNALINDLDLELKNTSTTEIWKPWVLSAFPHIDSLQKLPVRKRDSLNNVEQVTVDDPLAGNYAINVKGFSVTSAPQSFYIAYQFDSVNVFEWQFPTGSDFIFPGQSNTLRWNSTFPATTSKLEYSTDNGNNWQTVSSQVSTDSKYFKWLTPAVTTMGLLKMTVGSDQFTSDLFPVSPRPQPNVGFNCPDSFLLYWNKLQGVNSYRVYRLGSKYMEPAVTTTDTFAILPKTGIIHYSVAPLIGSKEGARSLVINITQQGVECYIRSFLASLNNNAAQLLLSLGTLYNISSIVLEKFNGTGFHAIQTSSPNTLTVLFTDANLVKGTNTYRVKLVLANGTILYSMPQTIYYFAEQNYILYPNPAAQYSDVNIAARTVDVSIAEVFNALGIKVYEKVLDDRVNRIPAGKLSKGVYYIRITNKGDLEDLLKLVVY